MRYRKRPVEIDAVQWIGSNRAEIFAFCGSAHWGDATGMVIETLEGPLHASEGDWVIKGVKNEFYPCKPDVFTMTYEPVDGEGGHG